MHDLNTVSIQFYTCIQSLALHWTEPMNQISVEDILHIVELLSMYTHVQNLSRFQFWLQY